MPVVRVFPMRDGPPIPYVMAELILEALRFLKGPQVNLGEISNSQSLGWADVPLIFGQIKKRDRAYHTQLMFMARNLAVTEDSDLVGQARAEVLHALDKAELPPPKVALEDMPDVWAEKNARVEGAPHVALSMPDPGTVPLTIVCWKWEQSNYKTRFTSLHVNTLGKMIKRHYKKPHRLICITDDPAGITEMETFPLWKDHANVPNASGKHLPSCYRRLKIFDPAIAEQLKAQRILSIDLDVVLTGDVTAIFDRLDPFVGWKVPGVHVDWVYNGSVFLFTPGPYSWIWETFDPIKSPELTKQAGYQGSDQGWISYCLKAREPGWGRHDGVMSYPREVRHALGLPQGARLVIFHGQRKPWDSRYSRDRQWIMKHWK